MDNLVINDMVDMLNFELCLHF